MHAAAAGRLASLMGITLLGFAAVGLERCRADEPPADAALISRDFGRIEFRGETIFAPDELRKALADYPEYQLLAHPAQPRKEFLSTISKRLTAGYHRAGFQQPEIAARWDAIENRVVVDIAAGKRYRKGSVEIAGATRLSKQMLEDWVLKPRPPQGTCPIAMEIGGETVTRWVKDGRVIKKPLEPIWTPQKLASFHQADLDYWRKELLRCCATQGYFDADLTTHVRIESDETATLVVTISAEGERATLGEIEITGFLRSSREELLQFLGLQPGMEVTETLKAELVQKLFDSGRFLEHRVHLGRPASPFGEGTQKRATLHLALYESSEAPLITEPRTPAEQAACRLAGWLNQLQVEQVDLAIEFQYRHRYFEEDHAWAVDKASPPSPHLYSGRAVVAPSHQSMEAEVRRTTETNGPAHFELAFTADNSGLTFKAPRRGERFTIPRLHRQIIIQVTGATHRPDLKGNSSLFLFGSGMRSSPIGNLPVAFEVLVSPAFLCREFSKSDTEFVAEGDRGILTSPQGRLEMDLQTGRLIELRGTINDTQFVVKTGSAVQQAVEVTDISQKNDLQLASDVIHPGSSALRFALNCIDPLWLAWGASPKTLPDALVRAERGLEISQNILTADILSPLDKLLSQYLLRFTKDDADPDFHIPPSKSPYFNVFFAEGNRASMELLAPGSWGRRVTHDFLLVMSNRQEPEANQVIDALLEDAKSRKLGPLAAWSAARLFSFMMMRPTDRIAIAGLDHLTLENVQEDVDQLLTPGAPLTRMAEGLIASIAATRDEEWETFVTSFLPNELHRPALMAGEICREFQENQRGALPEIVTRLYPDVIEPLLHKDLYLISYRPREEDWKWEQKHKNKMDSPKTDSTPSTSGQSGQFDFKPGDSLVPEVLKSPAQEE